MASRLGGLPANIKSNIAEASKLRPAQYGQSGYVENDQSIASLHSIHQHGLDPEALAHAILTGIADNAAYIIPYPEVRDDIATHFQAIVDSVAPWESDPEGARRRVEALENWRGRSQQGVCRGEGDVSSASARRLLLYRQPGESRDLVPNSIRAEAQRTQRKE